MKRLRIWLVFISLYLWRWQSFPSPLPSDWLPESKIGVTMAIESTPEYSDSATIIRKGIWYIKFPGYKEIIPGSKVELRGLVEPKWALGKVVQLKMIEPEIQNLGSYRDWRVILGNWRGRWVAKIQKNLPEPMASLAVGILLGVKGQMPQDFYQALVSTGTLHIVAASGYNVAIVAQVLMNFLGRVITRKITIVVGVIGIVGYVMIAGASASVTRAGIMASLSLVAFYFGRVAEAKRLLYLTGMIMLLINPVMILDIGFQLSFVATAGLLYIEPWILKLQSFEPGNEIEKQGSKLKERVQSFLAAYLYPTLAATMATLPIIWWHFGRVSWISPLVNILILPLIPLIMWLTAVTLILGQPVAWLLYPPLWWVVWIIQTLGKL